MMIAGACRSLRDTERCGDAFAWWNDGSIWTICLVDGLGHGMEAAKAAEAALTYVEHARTLTSRAVIDAADAGIRESRGVAMAIARVDTERCILTYAGVGNIRGALFGETVTRFEGAPGIVGAGFRSMASDTLSWTDGDMLLLWTDGFGPYLTLDQPSLRLKGDVDALAERLIATLSTGRDDAGIVCCRLEASPAP